MLELWKNFGFQILFGDCPQASLCSSEQLSFLERLSLDQKLW